MRPAPNNPRNSQRKSAVTSRTPIRHPEGMIRLALRAIVPVALLVACTSSGPQPTVVGTLHMVGGPVGVDLHVPGTVHVLKTDGSQIAQVDTATDGQFHLSLSPGTYKFVGYSPKFNGGQESCDLTTAAVAVAS